VDKAFAGLMIFSAMSDKKQQNRKVSPLPAFVQPNLRPRLLCHRRLQPATITKEI
jgi:hypothetical protein